VPLIFINLIDNINETNEDDHIENSMNIMKKFKLNMEMVKDNLYDLAPEKMKEEFDKISPTLKSAFTRLYNKTFQSSIIRKKSTLKKGKDSFEISNIKYDQDGNIIDEDNNINENEDNESSFVDIKDVKSKKSKKVTKTKKVTKRKSKNKKNKSSKNSSSFIDDSEEN
jgi:hypothetical protein